MNLNSQTFKFKHKQKTKLQKGKKYKSSKKGADDEKVYVHIERPVQHIRKGLSFHRVHFKDLDGRSKVVDVPRRAFVKKGEVAGLLLDAHAELPAETADRELCITVAEAAARKMPTLRITDSTGWDNDYGNGKSFVYFTATYGPAKGTLELEKDAARNAALGRKVGSLASWREGLLKPCAVADHLVSAIGIAASGPLYGLIGESEAAIYHFQGAKQPAGDTRLWKSSSGKTLCARVAQSLFGSCSANALFGFEMTEAGLEDTAYSCNNILAVLDEEGTTGEGGGAAVNRAQLPYRLLSGHGKVRSKSYALNHGLANRKWVLPVITTSENELDTAGKVRKEGARARMVSIPFPPTWQGGIFNRVEKQKERNDLAGQVEKTISNNYGVAMPKFIERLVEDRDSLPADVMKIRNDFVDEVGAATNSWEKRFAQKFGMILAAASLLVRYEIAPFTEERASEAIKNLYAASRSLTVSIPEATDALLNRLRVEVADRNLFPRLTKGRVLTAVQKKAAKGAVRKIGDKHRVVVIRSTLFKSFVEPSAVTAEVIAELVARGIILKDPKGMTTRQLMIKGLSGQKRRYLCITGLVRKKTLKQ